MRTVAAVVDQGALTFDFAIPCEVFGVDRSDIASPWYEFLVVAAGERRVRTQTGFVIEAPLGLDALDRADTIVVPGWSSTDVDPSDDLIAALRGAHRRGARIVSICTGAFVLASSTAVARRPTGCTPATSKRATRVSSSTRACCTSPTGRS
jgi:transcriptional regulator GlxA family with amidase domain